MIRHTIPRPPGRDDWLAARFPYVGASEVAVVLGASPYRTAGDLAAEKLGRTDGQPHNAAMERGNRLEDAVAQWWGAEHGYDVDEVEHLYVIHSDEEEPVLCATLDRWISTRPAEGVALNQYAPTKPDDELRRKRALEVKTTRDYITELPEHWQWQAQAQMLCAGLGHVDFAVLDASMSLKSFTVPADHGAQSMLYERCLDFMRHIRAGEFPPDVEMSYDTVQQLHPHPTTTRTDLDPLTVFLLQNLRLYTERVKSLEERIDALKGQIAHKLGDATDGYIDGKLAVTWRAQTRHTIDAKALRRDHPDIAREYETVTTSRRMLLK